MNCAKNIIKITKYLLNKKNIFLILFFLLLPFHNSFAVELRVFKVGAFDNYPVIFKDKDGVIKGLYVDILSEIGSKENIKFEYVFGAWNDGLNNIKSGKVDLLTSVGFTEDRALFMDYTKTPLLTVWGELYALQSSKIHSILEISNKKVGVLKGDINAINFKDLISEFDILDDIIEFSSYDEVFRAVADKKVDVGVSGITFGAGNKDKYGLVSTGIVFNPINLYFTTTKAKNADLIIILDRYLSDWRNQQNSFFYQVEQKWLYGSISTVVITPNWVKGVLFIVGITILIFCILIFFLRFKIKKNTQKISKQNEIIEESEKKYRLISENTSDGIIVFDVSGHVTYVSPSYVKQFGYDEKTEFSRDPKDILSIVHLEDRDVVFSKINKAIQEKKDGVEYYFRMKTKAGNYIWREDSARFLYDVSGNFSGAYVACRDITKRKLQEQKLLELDQAKNDFLSLTSHQLRTPLSANKWVLETLVDDKNITEKQKAKYTDLVSSNERLINLVNRLLNVTRIESGKLVVNKELVDIKKLIINLALSFKTFADHKHKNIKITAPKELNKISCDPVLIYEALENILKNAIDYSGENNKEIEIKVEDRKDDYLISVHDEGAIEQSVVNKINEFKKFNRGEKAPTDEPGGSGLGLYITKKIVEASGGKLYFESNDKEHTTFYLTVVK